MFKKSLIIVTMIAISPIAFASQDSPPIYFNIGDVKPGAQVVFDLETVLPDNGEAFSLTCDIQNPNYSKQYPIVLGMGVEYGYSAASSTITLNGKPLNSNQAALTLSDNFYAAYPIYSYYTLWFTNYDNSDTATVTNCVATPTVQAKAK